MASKDLQLVRSSGDYGGMGAMPSAMKSVDEPVEIQDTLLAVVVRKRWWLLLLCGAVSVSLAYAIAVTFGETSAISQGSLVFTGLLEPPGPNVYDPPRLLTYSELLLSTPTMKKLCDKHGLGVPPATLREKLQCQVTRDSDIMTLELTWADPEDAIEMVNDAMELLIDEAAEGRRAMLRERMKQVDLTLLEAKGELADVTEKLSLLRQQRSEQDLSGGLAGDRYNSQLETISATQTSIDVKLAERSSIEKQLEFLRKDASKYQHLIKKSLIDDRTKAIRKLAEQFKPGSKRWNEIDDVLQRLTAYGQHKEKNQSFEDWRSGFEAIAGELLSAEQMTLSANVQRWERELTSVIANGNERRLDLISRINDLELLEGRLVAYKKQAEDMAVELTGVSTDEIDEQIKKVEQAETRYRVISEQLENMRQLEQCKTPEFAISMPASAETTVVSSNKKKLFAMVTIVTGMVLVAPIFLSEWLRQRASPIQRVATRFGLPLIADRLIKDYAPRDRKNKLDWRKDEALRMLSLRIQQSSRGPASVIVFSGLRMSNATLPLISAVAECLAEREERVLLIDAVDPATASAPLSLINSQFKQLPGGSAKSSTNGNLDRSRVPGLAEYFSRNCEGVMDLIQPTASPGVDWIASGNGPFPSEALASSCVTELLDHCRKTYTMLLVAGPPVSSTADLQMLAARADGIVLTTDKKSATDPRCLMAVQDLIELGAPIIGVVG